MIAHKVQPMNDVPILRIAMWSGPRNISTAMMRAWGNRTDTQVIDEPFYAYYLNATEEEHPGAEQVIAAGESDWRKVAAQLLAEVPAGKAIFYQKQMTHHLLPEIDRRWLDELTNCFLIRDPREVIISYCKKNHEPTRDDLGFAQQAEIFDLVRAQSGEVPPVIDARDVLQDPARILGLLCTALGVQFSETMLSWPPGRRATDGIWAEHWYAEVERSTGFQPYQKRSGTVPAHLHRVYEECLESYERLHQYRLS